MILIVTILGVILNYGLYERCTKKDTEEYLNYKPIFKSYFKILFFLQLIKWYREKREGQSKGSGVLLHIFLAGFFIMQKRMSTAEFISKLISSLCYHTIS